MLKPSRLDSLFYLSVGLLVPTFGIEIIIDASPGWFGLALHGIQIAAIILLVMMTFFVLRPKIAHVSSSLALVNASMAQVQLLKTVVTASNEARTINEGLEVALKTICEYTGWPVGHVYILSTERNTLVSTRTWFFADPERFAMFRHATEAMEITPGEGFIGEIYADSTPMWIQEVAASSACKRCEIAASAGLKAAFAFPIFIGRKAVAVMEFYSNESHIPDEEILSLMANIGKQLGQVVERVRHEEEARLWETVVRSANDGIIITKADLTSPGPEIIYVNDAFTHITGYEASEVIGRNPRFLQGKNTDRNTLAAISESLQAGLTFRGELQNYSKDGRSYWLDISIVPIRDESGRITHYAAIERDISEQKAAKATLENTLKKLKRSNLRMEAMTRDLQESLEKAEEANKAKGDFLANMSHELRTPMNGVLGMAHLLADTALTTDQMEMVSTINGSAENLLMLLNDILDFSKIEAGALMLEHIAYDLKGAITNAVNLLRPQADKKSIVLEMECEPNIPAHVWGDPGRMHQIIVNLLGNAVKFTSQGHVRLVARVQEMGDDEILHISVEDTGIGIPAHKIGDMFKKFSQVDASVTRKFGGTGLGLAITKQLVTLMGGRIGVESAEGKGSTFWFAVPLKPAEASEVLRTEEGRGFYCIAAEHLRPIGEAKVLLVEDYPVNQVFARKLLAKFGVCHIDTAENGAQALLKYRSHVYDIIFMDCQMPELDGYQTTEKIRLMEEGTPLHTPIVAMTANAMMGDREKCLKAGMDDYLSKPLRAQHLKKVLETWFLLDSDKARVSLDDPARSLSAPEEVPVDLDQLRIFTDGDPQEERALAQLFLEQAQSMIDILQNSTARENSETWKSAAHRFKGSSGNLGAMRLHHLCRRAEAHFDDEEARKLEMLAAIQRETKRVEAFFG